MRVIKKYENRRLYDTEDSRYVNMEAIAEMIRNGEDLQVIETRSGDDVTRLVLTQIIVEGSRSGDKDGPPLEFLRDLIRASDQANRDFLQWYLSTAGEAYKRFQGTFTKRKWPSAKAQREAWAKMLDPMGLLGRAASKAQEDAASNDRVDAAKDMDELQELKRRLEELESRLS